MKLQRHALTTSNSHEKLIHLKHENALLKSELKLLNPHSDISESHPAVLQLTLSLKMLSDKLSLTEDALPERTTQLTHANAELTKATDAAEGAYALAAEGGRSTVRERDLEKQYNKMSILVVSEYADYVRSLYGRTSMSPRLPPNTSLSEAMSGIHETSLWSLGNCKPR